jgi:hypothetical protein
MQDEGKVKIEELKSRKLNFMINNTFLTGSLQELLDKVGILSTEESVDVYYTFALDKPKPTASIP